MRPSHKTVTAQKDNYVQRPKSYKNTLSKP